MIKRYVPELRQFGLSVATPIVPNCPSVKQSVALRGPHAIRARLACVDCP